MGYRPGACVVITSMPTLKVRRQSFSISVDGEPVPAILQCPVIDGRLPGVLLLHGFSSRKERMADSIGRALAARHVASLAIDLPLHGARDAGFEGLSFQNPVAVIQKWRLAVREAHAGLAYLEAHDAIDRRHLGIAGYSLGAYLATSVAADNPLARAVALAAGGDLPPQMPFASLVRSVMDPLRDVRKLDGRPLLMINGRLDRTIRPEQARALFDAASEPKELRWYDGGHWPPQSAIDAVAIWLAETLAPR
jgi:fermentation-respiration switch protein FrsA (DUF1100 family)